MTARGHFCEIDGRVLFGALFVEMLVYNRWLFFSLSGLYAGVIGGDQSLDFRGGS